jgi:seryl-tRNA synthetase
MLNLKAIQRDPDSYERDLKRRSSALSLDEVKRLDTLRKDVIREQEELRHSQRTLSEIFKSSAPADEKASARDRLKMVSTRVKELTDQRNEVELALKKLLMELPNPPDPAVPSGATEEDNVVVRSVGTPRTFSFEPKDHVALGEALEIVDFERGAKISGARFVLYRGSGARLERALASFMLDTHLDHGYQEILPPFLVTRESMTGTGQLPKFEEDAFQAQDDLFLIPTAEVPTTNMHRDEVLSDDVLPIKYCAFSSCFRREAGSYGKLSRGLIRLHQFQKVELVKFTRPEDSEDAHQSLLRDAERILQLLDLPYRVVELCCGDLGLCARRCFDIEVWSPGQDRFVEISSCSNFGDFQARRANIRYRPEAGAKPVFVHTINGSGLAIGRTIVAILENNQEEDGSVRIPKVLIPYMGGEERISAL